MKTNGKREVIAGITGPGLVLAALLAIALSNSIAGRAQSGTASLAAPAPTQAKAAPATQAAQPAVPGERKPGGNHEGITVHGHWVIEVKNPDGTVTARREFENSIQPAGMNFLAALIAANNSSGGLSILLNGAQSTFPGYIPTFTEAGPCVPLSEGLSGTGGPSSGTSCLITTAQSSTGLATGLTFLCVGAQESYSGQSPPKGPTVPCSTNLSITAPTWTGAAIPGTSAQVQLLGTVTVTASSPGNVVDAETIFTTCNASTTPSSCLTGATFPTTINLLTERNLDGQNGDPPQVPYSPGQMISVSVTISFQ